MKEFLKNRVMLTGLLIVMMISVNVMAEPVPAFVDGGEQYAEISVYESPSSEDEAWQKGNVTYASSVDASMAEASFWSEKLGEEADRILLSSEEIAKVNEDIEEGDGTGVFDITQVSEKKTQAERKELLAAAVEDDFEYMCESSDYVLYADRELVDNDAYLEKIKNAVQTTGFENNDEKVQLYAVAVRRTMLRCLPTDQVWGYSSPDDTDDEAVLASVDVNEPFIIRGKCVVDDKTYYWGYTNNCSGWVEADAFAIFETKQDWIDAWKVSLTGKDFLVVTQDHIRLNNVSMTGKEQEVDLKLGTILKLVPQEEIPETLKNQAAAHNYIAYLPLRNEEGGYEKGYAFISQHYRVSIGFLPLTQRNLLETAFTCLGNRYGWGGMLGAMDCTLFSRSIYRCFGIELPRNTSSQPKVPNRVINLREKSDEEKQSILESIPAGSVVYFPGHAMVYVGSHEGVGYVISDTGSLSDSEGETKIRNMNSVLLNPLTVRRRNGNTWLKNLTAALVITGYDPDQQGETQPEYVSAEMETESNISLLKGIVQKMCRASYWKQLLKNQEEVLLSTEEISALNQSLMTENGSGVTDLTGDFDEDVRYAIAVRTAGVLSSPEKDASVQGFVNVNDPFVIIDSVTKEDGVYYQGQTKTASGWIFEKNIAICQDKEEWLEAFSVTPGEKDFLVVTQNEIVMEPSLSCPETALVLMKMGTVLKLVPEEEMPYAIAERGPWNNYVVYFPVRNEEGMYERKMALISEHYSVSTGYLPLTQENVLETAFRCLGDRMDLSGLSGEVTSSIYTAAIYRCFGIDMPLGAEKQQNLVLKKKELTDLTDEEKINALSELPAGSLVFADGQPMLLSGVDQGRLVLIGTMDQEDGKVQTVVLRAIASGDEEESDLLSQVSGALVFAQPENTEPEEEQGKPDDDSQKDPTKDGEGSKPQPGEGDGKQQESTQPSQDIKDGTSDGKETSNATATVEPAGHQDVRKQAPKTGDYLPLSYVLLALMSAAMVIVGKCRTKSEEA